MFSGPTYTEFKLGDLIVGAQLEQPRADRRLNALENTLAALVQLWRPRLPIVPANEVRMSTATLTALLAWVEEKEVAADQRTRARLGVYASEPVINEAVPRGWVRALLR
jgi:hypothetical protein